MNNTTEYIKKLEETNAYLENKLAFELINSPIIKDVYGLHMSFYKSLENAGFNIFDTEKISKTIDIIDSKIKTREMFCLCDVLVDFNNPNQQDIKNDNIAGLIEKVSFDERLYLFKFDILCLNNTHGIKLRNSMNSNSYHKKSSVIKLGSGKLIFPTRSMSLSLKFSHNTSPATLVDVISLNYHSIDC